MVIDLFAGFDYDFGDVDSDFDCDCRSWAIYMLHDLCSDMSLCSLVKAGSRSEGTYCIFCLHLGWSSVCSPGEWKLP